MNRKENFQPDYTNILKVLYNQRPDYLPLYEHHIDAPFISKHTGEKLEIVSNSLSELEEYFTKVIRFWKNNGYDAFDYEAAICDIIPGHGAIMGGKGPIQTRDDFDKYPFDDIPRIFWETYTPRLETIRKILPPSMKAYGGCGYGIFESAQDLVGYESLCLMQYLDPDLFTDLFLRIGDLFVELWTKMVREYGDIFVFHRMGDDLGHKTATMLEPDTIRNHILPQYKRVIEVVHATGKKFLFHSCGNILDIMPDILACGIDAKHSNEDQICPFVTWIEKYGDKIGLFGGFDMNCLILNPYDDVFKKVLEEGTLFRQMANGYGLGSGNSIPDYMSIDGFNAMIDAVFEIRKREVK
jgi:uroporphyrinogen-III decarboxylase